MSRLAALLVAVAAVPLGAATSAAQDLDPGIVEAQTGRWLIAAEDGSRGCLVTLTKEPAIGGFGVEGAEACAGSVAAVADAAAWNLADGALILIDPLRTVVARFVESEGDPLRAQTGAGPAIDMVPAVDGVDRLPVAAAIKGAWVLRRPGGAALCTIDLADAPGTDGSYAMRSAGGCDPAIARFGFSRWSVSGLGVTLMNTDGNSLRFVATADGFAKDPVEGGKPLDMVRP